MKSRFFIMKLWQTGKVGSNNIKIADINPEEGFTTYNQAAKYLLKSKNCWEAKAFRYFAIMEIFTVTK